MQIYMLIPIGYCHRVKIKEREGQVFQSILEPDYSKYFGTENEYYIDPFSQQYDVSGIRDANCISGRRHHYTALDPHGVIRLKKRRKQS